MTRVTRQEPGLQTWPTISSRGSYAGQISDHYEDVGDNIDDDDDEDEEEDDDEDEEDDDEGIEDDDDDDDEIGFSDDSEEFSEGAVENKAFYKQSPAQDPQLDYLKGTQMTGMTRHQQFRPNYARKRQKAKTGAGKGARFRITNRSGGAGGFSSDASASVDTDISSEEQLFIQTCDEVTRLLLHGVGTMQQGLEYIISLVEFALQWRLEGTLSQDCPFTTNSLPLVEGAYLGAWAKVLIDHRRSSQIPSATMYLQLFVQHGCLILKQENVLPEHYALAMSMVLDKRDMDAFRRNSKRASRLSNSDREIDNSQLQQELRKVFTLHNGPEIFFKAIENQLSSDGRHDTKIRNLQLTLGVLSKSQLPTESDGQNEAQVAEAVTRLTTIVLDFFPDHLDAFKSVNKVAVVDIISHVGCLVLEIYRASTSFLTGSSIGSDSSMLREFDPSLDDFDHYDYHHRPQLSKSTLLGEVKFAEFRLEMAVRLMNTSRLDLRLAGLVELKEVLVRIQRLQHGISEVGPGGSRIRRRSDSDMEILQEQDKKPVENLCEKLKSLQIVGYFFGSNIHLELVQRSTDVLVFLVQINALTVQDIDLIWAAVGGNQHRSIVYGVYQVLSDLCSKIPQKFIHNLFEKLQAVPSESWDQQLVDLARALFQAMVQRSKYNPEEGSVSLIPYQTLLNVLRNSAMPINGRDDPSFGNTMTISPDVISGIAFLLSEGIRVGPPSLEDRATLVNQCLSDLGANHPGAVWSLQVLQHIFEHHFGDETEAQEFYTRACSSLPELYISNLQHYATAVKKLPPTPSPTVTSFAPLSTLLVSHEYFKNMQLKIRLGFLRVISRIVPVFWNSPELADTLWSNLIVDPIGPTEQDEAFQCLEAMSEPNFVEYVYDRLLPTLDVITITEKGWNCVRQYFLLVNWHRGNLIVKSEQVVHASQQIVVLAPLYGMEVIWKVALRARPPIVGHLATELLTSIMKTDASQEDSSSRVGVYEFREGLVETCVEHLVQSSDLLGDSNSMETSEVSLVFERCISILKSFLVACTTEGDTGRAGREIHGTLDEGSMLSIQINSNIIALRFGCSEPEEVRVFSLGKDLIPAWDHKTLEELQVDDGQTFLATKRPKQAIPPKRIVPKKRLPTDLLHQSEFFER
ncbi:putative ubiquitin carboxyl-terminal hydrolase FAF-X, partial [Lunasporangiospora selenospora]